MIELKRFHFVVVCLACMAAGWWLASSDSSPVNPAPQRPVVRLIARLAKTFLWVAVFAEPAPAAEVQLVHARVGADGQPLLDHGRGW
jgi:hypothetical protein